MPASPPVQRTRLAFSFSIDLTMHQMKAKLNTDGPWTWSDGDSHYYGDYIGAKAMPHDAVLRIYDDEPRGQRYAVNLRYYSTRPVEEARHDLEALKVKVLTELLPRLGARDVVPTEPVD